MLVIACLDLSPISERVVAHASALALALGAEMTLLHVAGPDPDFVGYEVGPETVRDAVAHKLRDQHRQLDAFRDHAEHEGVSTRAIMIQGPTLEKVLSQIERLGASYVVVGSHGHGGLHDLIAGSAIQGLLKRSPIPVVVVPPKP